MGKSELVCSFNDDRITVRYVQATFDNRSTNKDIVFPGNKIGHNFLQSLLIHLSMSNRYFKFGELESELSGNGFDGFYSMKVKYLSPSIDLCPNRSLKNLRGVMQNFSTNWSSETGAVNRAEISAPTIAKYNVLGIGVALKVRTSTFSRIFLMVSACAELKSLLFVNHQKP